jgi:hypothetical protein
MDREELRMSKVLSFGLALGVGLVIGALSGQLMNSEEEGAIESTSMSVPVQLSSFSAVPGAIGAQDISGPYEVVGVWPQDLASLPGHEDWTYGGA